MHVSQTFCFCVGLLLVICRIEAAISPGDHARTVLSRHDGTRQPYRLFVPEITPDSDAARDGLLPLLICLHGRGVNQDAWFDYTPVKREAQRFGFIVAAPHGRGSYFYRGPGEQDVLDVLDDVKSLCPVDPDRVYLIGHSMGGWGTWWLGLRHPDLFAAICPMAGMAPLDLLPNAKHLDPFIIHDNDDPIVEVEQSLRAARRLAELGLSFRYREEYGYGHKSSMIGDNLPRVLRWFLEHRRVSSPAHVAHVARTPAAGKAYWIRIIEPLAFPQSARVVANYRAPDHLQIQTDNLRAFAIDLSRLNPAPAGALTLTLDAATSHSIAARGTDVVFCRRDDAGQWNVERLDPARIPSYSSPVVARFESDRLTTATEAGVAVAVAGLLRKHLKADAAIVIEDMFALPLREITAAALLDLYLFPDERLGRFRCPGDLLRKAIVRDSPYRKAWWGQIVYDGPAPDSEKSYEVVAPMVLAEFFDLPIEQATQTIGESLLEAVSQRKVFP
jgi:poly(3-hydroxybutyrate) depolymerase